MRSFTSSRAVAGWGAPLNVALNTASPPWRRMIVDDTAPGKIAFVEYAMSLAAPDSHG